MLPLDARRQQGKPTNDDRKKGFKEVKFKRSKVIVNVAHRDISRRLAPNFHLKINIVGLLFFCFIFKKNQLNLL